MANNKCDVCHVNEMIGVACTAIPLSVAYCLECAQRNAQPECVFLIWEEEIPPKDHAAPDHYKTFKDGKYITYRKWYNARHKGEVHIPISEGPSGTEPGVPEGN